MQNTTTVMQDRLKEIEKEAQAIRAYLKVAGVKQNRLSPEALKRISEGQKRRWAKYRKADK